MAFNSYVQKQYKHEKGLDSRPWKTELDYRHKKGV